VKAPRTRTHSLNSYEELEAVRDDGPPRSHLVLVAPLVATLSGCTSIDLALGLRTRLASVPVSSLSASLSPGPALALRHRVSGQLFRTGRRERLRRAGWAGRHE